MAKKKQEPLREAKVVETPEPESSSDVYQTDDSFMLPNDGESYSREQQEEIQEQITEDQQMFMGNDKLVEAVFEWMDSEIAGCDSIEAARSISKEYKVSLENALIALNVCRRVFEGKRVTFQNIHDTINTKEIDS